MRKKLKSEGLKWLSAILVFTMFITYVPVSEFSAVFAEENQEVGDQIDSNEAQKFTTRKEIESLKTENSKTFLNPDGTYTSEISQTPIHFKNEQNKWEPIDNDLVSDPSENIYENKANSFKVQFDKQQTPETPIMQIEEEQLSRRLFYFIFLAVVSGRGTEPRLQHIVGRIPTE